jgi:hypothetical protein
MRDAGIVAEKVAWESASVEALKVAAEAGFEYVRDVRSRRVAPLVEDVRGWRDFTKDFPGGRVMREKWFEC